MRKAGVNRPTNPIGIGWGGPTIAYAGTDEQKAKYLPRLLSGEDIWCQLFSEPGAGSDLAALSTRAVEDGDEWVVNGQKIWTSLGHIAKFGILIARTDPDAPKHQGVSYFVCPMDLPGIEVRPIIEMTGVAPVQRGVLHRRAHPGREPGRAEARRVGAGQGHARQRARVAVGRRRAVGPRADGHRPHGVRPRARRHATRRCASASRHVYTEAEILRLIRLRTVSAAIKGSPPGPEASVRKALADEHGQHIMELAKDLSGARGMLRTGDMWDYGYLFAPALTIGGGTSEVQRNIIGERVLGLPHDIDVEVGKTWRETRPVRTVPRCPVRTGPVRVQRG